MRQKPGTKRSHGEKVVKDIRRATRKQYSAEEKIRIVLDGLKGEYSIAEVWRRAGVGQSLYYSCSKEFLEAGKKRLAGDTANIGSRGNSHHSWLACGTCVTRQTCRKQNPTTNARQGVKPRASVSAINLLACDLFAV